MSNYVASGRPFNGERNLSEVIRDEFTLIQDSIATKGESGGVSGTSTTSVTIGTGTKTFTMEPNKEIVVGMNMFAADTANPANNMSGIVTQYTRATGLIKISVSDTNGSGTKSSWSIGLANPTGVSLSANTFTGGQNFARATVASHATNSDIWNAFGNQIDFTGTETVTAFPSAPQAGAWRELICADACSFTADANLKMAGVVSGSTYTAEANDVIMVRALTTTTFLLTIKRYNGKPSMMSAGRKLQLQGNNGNGSTNTRIGRYTTVVVNSGEGTEWSYVDSVTLGMSVTILRSGWYCVHIFNILNGGIAGISINTTQPTATYLSLTNDSERFLSMENDNSDWANATFFGFVSSGSILRMHHSGNSVSSTTARLTIERIL